MHVDITLQLGAALERDSEPRDVVDPDVIGAAQRAGLRGRDCHAQTLTLPTDTDGSDARSVQDHPVFCRPAATPLTESNSRRC